MAIGDGGVNLEERFSEANRLRPIYEEAVIRLENFLGVLTTGYLKKPVEVDLCGHAAVRFDAPSAEDAILLKFARVVSLNRAMLLLMDRGFVQEQCIIQRSLEETNEDIMFYSVNVTGSGTSERFEGHLKEFWKEDYEDPNRPRETRIPRGFSRKGIAPFLHRASGLPDPSLADDVGRVIFSMYSGFTHGAAPHIFELYDFERKAFMTNGLLGTDRHFGYVLDGANSIYRSLLSASAVSKAFGSQELLELSKEVTQRFVDSVGMEILEKQ